MVLGFNSTHDGSAALVEDGEVVFAIEEERLTRVKHQGGFPTASIKACLEARGIGVGDLDAVSYYWNPRAGLGRFIGHLIRHLPGSLSYFRRQPGIWREMRGLPDRLRREWGYAGPFHFVDHHLAHAASTFHPSGFEEAAILTIDGTGEWTTTMIARGAQGRIVKVEETGYPHSLGKVYEALTQYLGFRPMSGEGKVMGLAPYGEPRHLDFFRRLVRSDGKGRFEVDLGYFRYHHGAGIKYSRRLERELGPPRPPESAIEDRHRDIAASLQARLEEVGLELAIRAREKTGADRLCLAGGVTLNCVMNGRIAREAGFREVFATPAAHDAGAALGSALHVSHEILGLRDSRPWPGTGLGPGFSDEDCRRALAARRIPFEAPLPLAEEVARRLAEGRIVAWFQGRMEYGPRALGHRSLLADPRPAAMRDRLNEKVKKRETFRPFAPSVLAEAAGEWFEEVRPSPHMLLAFRVQPEQRSRIAAVTHVDGSARVQTVERRWNPRFHDLIAAFGRRTGVPMLLNTSFNVRGQPIVCTPDQAIDTFRCTEIDDLVMGDVLVSKDAT